MLPIITRSGTLAALSVTLFACSGETDAASADGDNVEAVAVSDDAPDSATEPQAADWTGIEDPGTHAAIDARLADFANEYGPFGLVVVEALEGDDHWTAAGKASFDLGMPAIVVSTSQHEIHFAGDEGLAYFEDFRAELAEETAAYFDRGEFVEGVDHALGRIANFEG
ncbi:hypothetical protein [Parasphingopyxis marina]|uniref:TPM domain-containing protein n=1 Tax=Parasphingopyxis marina TaxID=2761622 RepID=A0A842HW63_9SPHN|nr:hypothetical protein [Parasphingopyxis marina]MBC2778318.1 hypothetical protein [Parasphingopyxis marina]